MRTLAERHQHILSRLKKEGKVSVVDLCRELDVSSVTIRKDLKLLEDKSLLFRTHGGGTSINPYTVDRPVNEKEKIHAEEKHRIGMVAAALIEPNDCVIIASGTSVLSLARCIKPEGTVTVITAALNVATELNVHPGIEVLLLGGILRKSSSSATGIYAEKVLDDFSCSKLFLGVDGIDMEFGLSTTNVMEAQLNRKMIAASQKTIVLADSSKFGKRGFGRICGLEDVEQVITDAGISEHTVEMLKGMGIEVTIV
ncbi:MAG: transcriptional regulator [Sphingobacteriales bacterium SCN 48-20]|jgi:DeoR family transcriptional regulator of aga operon|uniref:DeoR/GlpR family DNA-binding transcription regulator n=1 Tax=Terrimonas ferruginea TaxID=249 RepID=UPI0004277ACF|nr:DeoR/GlpR family DNA-binding transcription regulator [Terrimonas ferruginea]MBN8782576.1 DeoR/GlpR transcriptional regulator [Terrimonas ferruginea]ODT94758.1 MAG: transcriptional regulator [Sphingobacteriales bacterium SCN 48-20]OJW43080.1 MAG: transcriptional regulator [Sphingobacteriales bacterium 48-107]